MDGAPSIGLDSPALGRSPGLFARAKGLVCSPCAEWERIDAEPATVRGLFLRLVLPLAAIGPLALAVNGLAFSHPGLGLVARWPILSVVLGAAVVYGLSLIMTWLLALAIDYLAPGFCGCKNRVQAFKLAAYAGVVGWLAGAFAAVPWLEPMILVGGAYSLFLLYRGLPRLMRAPPDRALGYTLATVGVALAFGVLVFVVLGSVGAAISCFTGADVGAPSAGERKLGPGGVDLAQLAAAARQAQLAAAHASPATAGPAVAMAPDRLETLLPARLGDLPRLDVHGVRHAAVGYAATSAQARYRRLNVTITLGVTDLVAARALTAFAAAFDLDRSKSTAHGYQRISTIDGRPTVEMFDRRGDKGQYAVLIAGRFLVRAEGEGASMDVLRQAVADVDAQSLETLAHAG
jgi:hypothetical protein